VIEHFVSSSTSDVQNRFEEISSDVKLYFAALESSTPDLCDPYLRIVPDQDRSAVLEVMFHGKSTSPAYKYLSESQLSSFGLAVFFASVRQFNPDFPFIVLDDVVNSLDGYKRPQLLQLMKNEFADHQILLLTHDSAWRDRLCRRLPDWKRISFIRHDFGVGPIQGDSLDSIETVEALIEQDKPMPAGAALGPILEFEFQEACEAFEVELKYNRRNEYTLEPLVDGFRTRVQKKLGAAHPLTVAVAELRAENGFRNLCAHAKDLEIPLTPEELQIVVDKWDVIRNMIRCGCGELAVYQKPDFQCPCGKVHLQKVTTGNS